MRGRVPIVALTLLALLALLPASSGGAASRELLVVGDSLAVGTKPHMRGALPGWRLRHSVAVSKQHYHGPADLRALGRSLPRVIHVSLGTNGDPRDARGFRSSVREVMEIAGPRRCVVWANIVRPPVAGASYARLNRVLSREARGHENLRVVNWVRLVRRNPGWLSSDGVHVSAKGYAMRARHVAKSVKRCP